MKHPSQTYKSTTYKVLDSLEDMQGMTVIGVIHIADLTILVNTASLLVVGSKGEIIGKEHLLDTDLESIEALTAITKDQLI